MTEEKKTTDKKTTKVKVKSEDGSVKEVAAKPGRAPKPRPGSEEYNKSIEVMGDRQNPSRALDSDRDREYAGDRYGRPKANDQKQRDILPGVKAREGFVVRWFPTKILDSNNNLQRFFDDGWTKCSPSDYPDTGFQLMEMGSDIAIVTDNMVLCEIEEWRAEELNLVPKNIYRERIDRVSRHVEGDQRLDYGGRVSKNSVPPEWYTGPRKPQY